MFSKTGEVEQVNRVAMGRVGRHIFIKTGEDEQANRVAMAKQLDMSRFCPRCKLAKLGLKGAGKRPYHP
ncbi:MULTISPECIES: hypothetical protein [Bartonella]|uniref:hypothetical protein n=1 Tax=Bartonella TaxID=773 RepID=UPI0018DDD84E|nr:MULTISPECIES: hypothetical protein [Bartonella]MBH9975976.1 hypothetical protein [Bartonella choladocola]MBI0015683.1 hypothetical protein [Bartonella sp. B10834G3]MBI0141322.1 hypothetical protein [Bartonella choladocola]